MKRVKNIWTKAVLFVALCLAFPFGMKAQDVSDSFFHIDWQFNVPLNNKFAGVASGWGMNFEGGYYFPIMRRQLLRNVMWTSPTTRSWPSLSWRKPAIRTAWM